MESCGGCGHELSIQAETPDGLSGAEVVGVFGGALGGVGQGGERRQRAYFLLEARLVARAAGIDPVADVSSEFLSFGEIVRLSLAMIDSEWLRCAASSMPSIAIS